MTTSHPAKHQAAGTQTDRPGIDSASTDIYIIPLSDGIPARRFPIVNVALILANFCVWILYELPHLNSAVYHASFYACTVNSTCHGPEPWQISWFTAMFMHGSWDHILGNMLFLAVFGKRGLVRAIALPRILHQRAASSPTRRRRRSRC